MDDPDPLLERAREGLARSIRIGIDRGIQVRGDLERWERKVLRGSLPYDPALYRGHRGRLADWLHVATGHLVAAWEFEDAGAEVPGAGDLKEEASRVVRALDSGHAAFLARLRRRSAPAASRPPVPPGGARRRGTRRRPARP